jgi:hypothetical protein
MTTPEPTDEAAFNICAVESGLPPRVTSSAALSMSA